MAFIPIAIRAQHKVTAAADVLWSIAFDSATSDEGTSNDLTVTLDPNGVTRTTTAYIDVRTPTASEFETLYSGETQAKVSEGHLTEGYTALFEAAAASAGVEYQALSSGCRLGFPVGVNSLAITRVSADLEGDQGDRRLSHLIENPSQGTISDNEASWVITDISTAPGAGELASIELSNSFVDRLGVGVAVATGTEIASFAFKDSEANTLTPGASALTLVNDAGGRFAIHDAGSGNDRYKLRHTAVAADFEDTPAPKPLLSYTIIVSGVVSGVTIQQSLKLYPRNQAILEADVGDQTANVVEVSTADEFKSTCNTDADDRTIRFASGVSGVLTQTTSGQIKLKGERITIVGRDDVVYRNPNGVMSVSDCKDVLIKYFAAGPGEPATTDEQDATQIWGGGIGGTGDWIERILYDHCIFFAGNDELWRVTGIGLTKAPRGCRITRSIICYPFYDASHPKGAAHNYGAAVSDWADHVMIDHSIIWGCRTRMPQINGSCGVYVVNNIIGFWADNSPASFILGGRGTLAENTGPSSSIWKGNLYVPRSATAKARALEFNKVNKAVSHHFVDTDNHFINPATDTFANDALTTSNGIVHVSCSDASVLQSEAGFAVADFTPDATATEQNRRDLFADIVADCGNGSALCDYLIAHVQAGTADENVTPAAFATLFGGADWPDAVGDGFPDASSTGTTGALTAVPGSATSGTGWAWDADDFLVLVNGAAATVSGLDIDGSVFITGAGATLENCHVKGNSFAAVMVQAADVTVQDCEIEKEAGYLLGLKGIWFDDGGENGQALRNNIHSVEDGVYISDTGVLVEDNYIHDLAVASADPHYDGIQGDTGAGGATIRHNHVDIGITQNACVGVANVDGATIDDNLLKGGGYTLRAEIAGTTNLTITDNRLGAHEFGYYSLEGTDGTLVFTGNVDDDTEAPIAGP